MRGSQTGSVATVSGYPKGVACLFPGLVEYALVTLCVAAHLSLKDLTSSWGVQGCDLAPWAQSLPFCSLRML